MTIVNDGVDMVKGVIELNDTYSKLLANADAYNMYMDVRVKEVSGPDILQI